MFDSQAESEPTRSTESNIRSDTEFGRSTDLKESPRSDIINDKKRSPHSSLDLSPRWHPLLSPLAAAPYPLTGGGAISHQRRSPLSSHRRQCPILSPAAVPSPLTSGGALSYQSQILQSLRWRQGEGPVRGSPRPPLAAPPFTRPFAGPIRLHEVRSSVKLLSSV